MMKKNSFLFFLFSLVLMVGIGIFNCTGVFAAQVGDILTEPEEGWKRYDDHDKNIKYIGEGWNIRDNYPSKYYSYGTTMFTTNKNGKIEFGAYKVVDLKHIIHQEHIWVHMMIWNV